MTLGFDPDTMKYSDLTVTNMMHVLYSNLVARFTSDDLRKETPSDELGSLMGMFEVLANGFGKGLSPATAQGTILEPFFDRAHFPLRTMKPMSRWAPSIDVIYNTVDDSDDSKFIAEENVGEMKVRWFTYEDLHRNFPWLGKGARILWANNLKPKKRDARVKDRHPRQAVVCYPDLFRRYVLWLIDGLDLTVKANQEVFDSLREEEKALLEPLTRMTRAERVTEVVKALRQTMNLRDWILVKMEKKFRKGCEQTNARRQWKDGKFQIVTEFMDWAYTNAEVFATMFMYITDILVYDKGAGQERMQSIRMIWYALKDVRELQHVWIAGVNPQKKLDELPTPVAGEHSDLTREKLADIEARKATNRLLAEADWAKKVFALRLCKVRSDIDELVYSNERRDDKAVYNAKPSVTPKDGDDYEWLQSLRPSNVSPVWSISVRLGFHARWSGTQWTYTPREVPLPEEDQAKLWDTSRKWLWTAARDAAIKAMKSENKKFRRKDVEKLVADHFFDPWIEVADEFERPIPGQYNQYGNPVLQLLQDLRSEGDRNDEKLLNIRSRAAGGARVVAQVSPEELAKYGEDVDPREECRGKPIFSHGVHTTGVFACEGILPEHANDPLAYMETVELVRKILLILLAWFNKVFDHAGFEAAAYAHLISDENGFEARTQKILEAVRAGTMNALISLEWEAYARFEGPKREAGFKGMVEWVFKNFTDICLPHVDDHDIDLLDKAGDIATVALWKHLEYRLTKKVRGKYETDISAHARKGWLAKCRFVWLSYVKEHPWAGDVRMAEEEMERMIAQGAADYEQMIAAERVGQAQA